jgi:hypothetical protein
VISFVNNGTGFDEFLLLECLVNTDLSAGITTIAASEPTSRVAIYSASGVRRQSLERGLNIVIGADGVIRKIFVK